MSASNRESFCGVHACCLACATSCAKQQIWGGRLPHCFEPSCKFPADPLVVMRLLPEQMDQERYLALALWSNPRVEACPRCQCLLYAEGAPPAQGGYSSCPSCRHVFCVDCRCARHDGATCHDALAKEHERLASSAGTGQTASEAPKLLGSSTSSRRQCAGSSLHRAFSAPGDELICFERDARFRERSFSFGRADRDHPEYPAGVKRCPRCRVVVEKGDDGCEHIRCWQCGHEFCWLCLADRTVIYAHGNHHHRPGCRLFAAYNGPPEYLPDRCPRCALHRRPCEAPKVDGSPLVGQRYTALFEACTRWFQNGVFFSTCSAAGF